MNNYDTANKTSSYAGEAEQTRVLQIPQQLDELQNAIESLGMEAEKLLQRLERFSVQRPQEQPKPIELEV